MCKCKKRCKNITHLCETNSTVLLETWWAKILLEFSKPIYTVLNAVTVPLANSEAMLSCFWLFSSLCSIIWLKALVLNRKDKKLKVHSILFSRKMFFYLWFFMCGARNWPKATVAAPALLTKYPLALTVWEVTHLAAPKVAFNFGFTCLGSFSGLMWFFNFAAPMYIHSLDLIAPNRLEKKRCT